MSFIIDQKEYLKQQNLFPIPYSYAEKLTLRSGIKFLMHETFKIPYPITYKFLSYYKLLYWTGYHTLESIEAGMIVRDDIAFIVKYHDGLTRGDILAKPSDQYCLSFRASTEEWSIDPIVLISATTEIKRNL